MRRAHGQIRRTARQYGDSDEAEASSRGNGWERELTEEEAGAERERIEELNRACEETLDQPELDPDPHREGIDWVRTESAICGIRSSIGAPRAR